MPASVGVVDKILQGDFTSKTRPNWLVFGEQKISLCSVLRSPTPICVKVMENVDQANYDFSFRSGGVYIAASERARRNAPERTAAFSKAFGPALVSATKKLSKILKSQSTGAVPSAALKSALPAVSLMSFGDGDDDLDTPDSPGEASGSGDWGGMDDGGFGVVCGPILPTAGQDYSLCTTLGINCPKEDDAEKKRCDKVRQECRKMCSDNTLGTKPGNDGWNFYTCLNQCVEASNCTP